MPPFGRLNPQKEAAPKQGFSGDQKQQESLPTQKPKWLDREKVTRVSSLVQDLVTVDEDYKHSRPGEILCQMCDATYRKQASKSCQECQVHFCQYCLEAFHKRGPYREHELVRPDQLILDSEKRCEQHREKLKVLCLTCGELLCTLCREGNDFHGTHDVVDIKEGLVLIKRSLTEVLCYLGNIHEPKSDTGGDKQRSWLPVERGVEEIKQALEVASDQFQDQVEQKMEDFQRILQAVQTDLLDEMRQEMLETTETLDAALSAARKNNLHELVQKYQSLHDRLWKITWKTSHTNGGFPSFNFDSCNTLNAIRIEVLKDNPQKGGFRFLDLTKPAMSPPPKNLHSVPYRVTTMANDGYPLHIMAAYQDITAMSEYSSLSKEELRHLHYSNKIGTETTPTGDKQTAANVLAAPPVQSQSQRPGLWQGGMFGWGAQSQASQGAGFGGAMFGGQAANQAGLFGQQQATNQGGLFGQQTPNHGRLFGQQTTNHVGLFGQQTTNHGGLFGQQATNPGGSFGQQENTQSGLFGQQANTQSGLFGQQPANQGGLFGQQAINQGGLFGQQPTNPGRLFGQQANTQSGLFGQQPANQGGLFGQQETNPGGLFGQQANTQSGLFGQQANTQSGLFGQQPTSQSGLFGQQASNRSDLFDKQQANQGGLFGGQSANQSGSFGGQAAIQGGLFGGQTANQVVSFGGQTANQSVSFGEQLTNQGGLFGQKVVSQDNTKTSDTTSVLEKPNSQNIGGIKQMDNPLFKVFGSVNTSKVPQGVGFVPKGSPVQQTSFGQSAFSSNQQGGFSFGNNSNQNQQQSGFSFGSNSTQLPNVAEAGSDQKRNDGFAFASDSLNLRSFSDEEPKLGRIGSASTSQHGILGQTHIETSPQQRGFIPTTQATSLGQQWLGSGSSQSNHGMHVGGFGTSLTGFGQAGSRSSPQQTQTSLGSSPQNTGFGSVSQQTCFGQGFGSTTGTQQGVFGAGPQPGSFGQASSGAPTQQGSFSFESSSEQAGFKQVDFGPSQAKGGFAVIPSLGKSISPQASEKEHSKPHFGFPAVHTQQPAQSRDLQVQCNKSEQAVNKTSPAESFVIQKNSGSASKTIDIDSGIKTLVKSQSEQTKLSQTFPAASVSGSGNSEFPTVSPFAQQSSVTTPQMQAAHVQPGMLPPPQQVAMTAIPHPPQGSPKWSNGSQLLTQRYKPSLITTSNLTSTVNTTLLHTTVSDLGNKLNIQEQSKTSGN